MTQLDGRIASFPVEVLADVATDHPPEYRYRADWEEIASAYRKHCKRLRMPVQEPLYAAGAADIFECLGVLWDHETPFINYDAVSATESRWRVYWNGPEKDDDDDEE